MIRFDSEKIFIGFRLGFLIGAVVALFKAPRIRLFGWRSETNETGHGVFEIVTAKDPITESIAEGKEAAKRRRQELGLS